MNLRVAVSPLVLALVFSLSASARADGAECTDPTRLAKLKTDANAAFGAGRFEEALAHYERAFACATDTSLLFNMAKADLRLGRYLEGLEAIRRFQREATGFPDEILQVAKATEAELAAHVGTLSVKSNIEGATVRVDDRDLGPAPLSDVEVVAGKVTVRVSANEREPLVRIVDLAPGKHRSIDASFEIETPAAPAPAAPRHTSFRPSPLVWVGVSFAGAGLVVGVSTGAASLAKVSKIKEKCVGNRCPASTESERSKANTLANVSNVSFGIAAAGAVVGGIGIALSFRKDEIDAKLSFSPNGLFVDGTF